jgi:hypothetical protein
MALRWVRMARSEKRGLTTKSFGIVPVSYWRDPLFFIDFNFMVSISYDAIQQNL